MKAVLCRAWGGPESLAVDEVPAPEPAPDQVLVAVAAAGVNFADTLMIAGKYQEKPPFPFSPGLEIAGTVRALGANVSGLREGQRVIALTDWGGYAEAALARAGDVYPIPDALEAARFGWAEAGTGGWRRGGRRRELRRCPGERRQVSGKAAVPLLAGSRDRGHGPRARGERQRAARGPACHRPHRLGRLCGGGARAGRRRLPDSGCAGGSALRLGRGGGVSDHLRHRPWRAAPARRSAGGRGSAGTWRGRWRRDRQGVG